MDLIGLIGLIGLMVLVDPSILTWVFEGYWLPAAELNRLVQTADSSNRHR